jgi:uncharacterized membrane protein
MASKRLTKNNWAIFGVVVFILSAFAGGSIYFKFFLGEKVIPVAHTGPMTAEEKRQALESVAIQQPAKPMTDKERQAALAEVHGSSTAVMSAEEKAQAVEAVKTFK